MSDMTRIPKEAWEGVGDPPPDLHKHCPTCKGDRVRSISMGDMMRVPPARLVNAHTFLMPNFAWGYIQCDDCETRQERTAAAKIAQWHSLPWWKRLWFSPPSSV